MFRRHAVEKFKEAMGRMVTTTKTLLPMGFLFQLAARLAMLTSDADALSWAEKAYD
jgi:hypothetical protein